MKIILVACLLAAVGATPILRPSFPVEVPVQAESSPLVQIIVNVEAPSKSQKQLPTVVAPQFPIEDGPIYVPEPEVPEVVPAPEPEFVPAIPALPPIIIDTPEIIPAIPALPPITLETEDKPVFGTFPALDAEPAVPISSLLRSV